MLTLRHPTRSNGFEIAAYRDFALFLLLACSMTLSFFLGQDDEIERGSLLYVLVTVPFLLVPLLQVSSVVLNLADRVMLISAFSIISGLWFAVQGEVSVVFQLFFWAYILAYISCTNAVININSFAKLFVFLVIFGFFIDTFLDINHYGFLASKNYYVNDSHRLSLYPNIANSGFFAFIFIALYSQNLKTARKYAWILIVSVLIAVFARVRSIQIAILLYLLFRFFLEQNKNMNAKWILFFCAVFSVLPLYLTSAYRLIYDLASNSAFLLNFLFRGVADLSSEGLDNQVFRPLVWAAHWNFFADSDYLMGVGPSELGKLVYETLPYGDSVGFLSRLLALYGLPSILFFLQILLWLANRASQKDIWACALFPSIFFLMMNWGSVFHPANGFAVLLLLILARGSAFVDFQSQSHERV